MQGDADDLPAMAEEPSGQLLIVDDDPELLQFLLEELSQDTQICQGANCGAEALLLLRQQHFDLVVLDWNLPDFNGLVLTRHIRQTYGDIPVVILSGLDMLEYYQAAQESGASAFISKRKEFVTENVIACVEDILYS